MSDLNTGNRTNTRYSCLNLIISLTFIPLVVYFLIQQETTPLRVIKQDVRDASKSVAEIKSNIDHLRAALDQASIAVDAQYSLLDRTVDNITPLSEMQEELSKLKTALDRVAFTVDAQSSILDRSIGKVTPIQMPAEWMNNLERLELISNNNEKWPKSLDESNVFQETVNKQISEIPAWAESGYLARLNVIRWSAMVFTTVNVPSDSIEELYSRAEILSELIEYVPDGTSKGLVDYARLKYLSLTKQIDEMEWKEIKQSAMAYINATKTPAPDSIIQIISFLESQNDSNVSHRNAEAEELIEELTKIIVCHNAAQQVELIQSRIELLSQIRNSDPQLFLSGIEALANDVRSMRLSVALSGVDIKGNAELLVQIEDQLLAALHESQRKTMFKNIRNEAKVARDYQRYTLEEIKNFNERFENRSTIAQEALRRIREDDRRIDDYSDLPGVQHAISKTQYRLITGRVYDSHEYKLEGVDGKLETHLEFLVCRDSIVTYLLPVDIRLLEIPVQEIFNQAWHKGWMHLEGRDEQNYIAERTADVRKSTLSDMMEEDQ